ncbi:HAD hydrolase-like protein [Streptomyces sp. NPDC052101]|uniref:HAD family hydrolase n=1 Tax=Streptomyces sp. NPDC052101 TaxID=3155763 RepID=UPI00344030FE
MRQNTEPTRLLRLWVETSNTSPNGTGASCVAHTTSVTRSVAALKTLTECIDQELGLSEDLSTGSSKVPKWRRIPGWLRPSLPCVPRARALTVFTGASSRAAGMLVRSAGLHIDVLIGGDHVSSPKPAWDRILLAAKELGIDAVDIAYVGDSPLDLRAAVGAGSRGAAAAWGHMYDQAERADVVLSGQWRVGRLMLASGGVVVAGQPSRTAKRSRCGRSEDETCADSGEGRGARSEAVRFAIGGRGHGPRRDAAKSERGRTPRAPSGEHSIRRRPSVFTTDLTDRPRAARALTKAVQAAATTPTPV